MCVVSGSFGCFEWSGREDKILYVAEKKYPKSVSYFTKETVTNDGEKKPDTVKVRGLSG